MESMIAWRLGQRTLLTMTCAGCRKLMPGAKFGRHARRLDDPRTYIDRRCASCKWGVKAK